MAAAFDLSLQPHRIIKMSGIGCSSKTPAYFLRQAHGFNGVHGRMPTLATGANAANGEIMYIGVSGDGDSLSIGIGHLAHAIRRNEELALLSLSIAADAGAARSDDVLAGLRREVDAS